MACTTCKSAHSRMVYRVCTAAQSEERTSAEHLEPSRKQRTASPEKPVTISPGSTLECKFSPTRNGKKTFSFLTTVTWVKQRLSAGEKPAKKITDTSRHLKTNVCGLFMCLQMDCLDHCLPRIISKRQSTLVEIHFWCGRPRAQTNTTAFDCMSVCCGPFVYRGLIRV